jgi:tetratricopeptide (TPR) repeat protein
MKRTPGPPVLPGLALAQPVGGANLGNLNVAAFNPEALLRTAIAAHEAGRLQDAERGYRAVIQMAPRNAAGFAHLGALLLEKGLWEEGADILGQSLKLDPRQPSMLSNRGTALMNLGRTDEAVECFEAAIRQKPRAEQPNNYNNLAIYLQSQGLLAEAIGAYDRAIALNPREPQLWGNRGIVMLLAQRPAEALNSLDKALALDPLYVDAITSRGVALYELDRPAEALEAFERALALQPDRSDTHNNKGLALNKMDRPQEALESVERAMALGAGEVELLNNKGLALQALDRPDEALIWANLVLEMRPDKAEHWNNRGMALQAMGRSDEALADFRKALQIDPDYVDPKWTIALILLREQQYEEGWRMFEWRWMRPNTDPMPQYPCPLWLGETPIAGKTLLVHAEQGFGDTLHMLRFPRLVADMGGTVIVGVQDPLVDLASRAPGVALAVGADAQVTCDLHIPMMSLPLAVGARAGDLPPDMPYLSAPADKLAAWAARLGPRTGKRRIGLAWSGNTIHKNDRNRSIGLSRLLPVLETDAEFHCLHKAFRPGDAERIAQDGRIRIHAEALEDFSDTAALIEQLDLVISVDTSVVHLAGALAKPVWILLPFNPDYRWHMRGETTAWYPTARLFRQPAIGDWDSVIADVLAAL